MLKQIIKRILVYQKTKLLFFLIYFQYLSFFPLLAHEPRNNESLFIHLPPFRRLPEFFAISLFIVCAHSMLPPFFSIDSSMIDALSILRACQPIFFFLFSIYQKKRTFQNPRILTLSLSCCEFFFNPPPPSSLPFFQGYLFYCSN